MTERNIIGRWESGSGKDWVELYRDAHGYGYDGRDCGGTIGPAEHVTEADAVRYIENRTAGGAGYFHAGKRPMRRTLPDPATTPAKPPTERSNDYSTANESGTEFIANKWVFTGPRGYRVVPHPDGEGFQVHRYNATGSRLAGYSAAPMTEDDAHTRAARLARRI